jgi:ATP-binding cassette subfamily B protein
MASDWLGVEAEPVVCPYREVERFVKNCGPAIVRLPGEEELRFLALIASKRECVLVLGPDLGVHRVDSEMLQSRLTVEIEAEAAARVDRLLVEVGIRRNKRARARRSLLAEQVGHIWIRDCWLLRLPQGQSLVKQAHQAGLISRMIKIASVYTLQYLLVILSWWVFGRSVFSGQLDQGWLLAWSLLLLTAVPFRMLAAWLQGSFAVDAGSLLKKRLLYGALRLEPEEIKHEGAGHILGRVIESGAIETLAMSGGILGLVAIIELVVAAAILAMGAGGFLHLLLLAGWLALTMLAAWWYLGRRRRWTYSRLSLTNDLIERMVGHRTRLAQEDRERWHEGEDQVIDQYIFESTAMDKIAMLQAASARGWLVVAIAGLAPAFMSLAGSPALMAITLGGIIMASRALTRLVASLSSLLSLTISWQQVAALFRAATRPRDLAPPAVALHHKKDETRQEQALIEASDLTFQYGDRREPVLRKCDLRIKAGDRILLQGSSGGGKSTLSSLISGMRSPTSGLLLLGGLDRKTLGIDEWRRRVASAPQFHENYVLTGTLALNLLMGRRWPPEPGDLEQAESLCRELGLGPLLNRMPSGMLQLVGETGWQLSHGERSRLYMARALLQDSDVVILDESFAALDPETLSRCLKCALDKSNALVVVAHP